MTAAKKGRKQPSIRTLWAIAKRYGVSLQKLTAANPQIKNPNLIYPGNEVYLP